MRHLNYDHLLYFWTVVREGSIARAAETLHVTPQTISGQVKLLEREVQGRLLERSGRRLVPTELGRIAFEYAQEIFPRGQELANVLRGAPRSGPVSLTVGVSDAVPKLVTWRVLAPLLSGPDPVRVTCEEGPLDLLLSELAVHELDLVLSTSALPPDTGVKAFSHLLGESELLAFGTSEHAKRLRKGFPQSLSGAPWLLPTERSAARRSLDAWFAREGIVPRIVAEFDDDALMKTFGQGGAGIFSAPAAIEQELRQESGVVAIGRLEGLRGRFYAITPERRIRHPAVAAITQAARSDVFEFAAGGTKP